MKNKKSFKNRIAAGLMSAAMLTSANASAMMNLSASAADNDYYEALALSLYFYDANACGSDVSENCLTWRGDCHVEDEKALLSNATNFDSSFTSLVDPDGDGKVDVGGGYHDAGDHIKFSLTMGFGMSSLAMSEYLNPGVYEKAGCKEHLMAILKRNAEYMMKTTFLNSSGEVATICYVVADGGADHSMMTPPEEQHYDRATYWLTANRNNSAACGEMAAALAGAAYVWKDADSNFSKECLKYAKAIYNFGSQHKGNEMAGQSPYYSTNEDSQDELLLAQAWLYINGEGSKPTIIPNEKQYGSKYDGYRYSWDKVYQGYSALMYKKTGEEAFKNALIAAINDQGGLNPGKYNGDGWGAARYNCALQMSGYAVANGDANSQYATGGKWQMDYILGDNPTGYSFLVGYGSKWPTHVHHRAANPGDLASNPEAKYTLYGYLVGGIDASGNYQDHSDKYEYTEGALDYNGCFALACAGLANLYGGSDKGAANIASKASEITYPFSFTSGTTVVTPTETPTEAPTQEATERPTETQYVQPTETQWVQPTEATQPATQQTSSGETEAKVTEKKGTWEEDGSPRTYWGVDTTNAKKVIVTLKISSNDTEATGCFNPSNAKDYWEPTDWKAKVSNGTVTLEYTPKAGETFVDVHVWWPKDAATLVSAVKVTDSASQPVTEATERPTEKPTERPTEAPTQQTQPQTEATQQTGNVNPGDADCNGSIDILDVISINKAILGKETLSTQGLNNIDFNRNNKPDADEAMKVLKCIVGILNQNQLF